MPTTTHVIRTPNGTPLLVPNRVTYADGCYVSYNNYDTSIYGCDTTAIVIDRTGAFLILDGDHRNNLAGLNLKDACQYFHDNVALKNKMSDPHEDFVLKL